MYTLYSLSAILFQYPNQKVLNVFTICAITIPQWEEMVGVAVCIDAATNVCYWLTLQTESLSDQDVSSQCFNNRSTAHSENSIAKSVMMNKCVLSYSVTLTASL